MGRRDIASMLGVAHETVSRSFTALAVARLIHVNDRDVEILDMDGLKAYSRSTRRSLDDIGAASRRRLAAAPWQRGQPSGPAPAGRVNEALTMQLTLPSLIESRIGQLSRPLALQWPGGHAGAPDAPVHLKVNDTHQLRWLASGHIGTLADAYVRGDLDIEGDLREVVEIAAELAGDPVAQGHAGTGHPVAAAPALALAARQHKDAEQVRFHYDLSDDFFALWLDPLRVYSCAYYERADMTLAQAQEAKLEHICRKLQLQPGQLFLDIGAGWGGLLLWAAEHHGVHAMGITLSRHQHAHVNRLIDKKGLRDRVDHAPARLPRPAANRALRPHRVGRHVRARGQRPARRLLRAAAAPAQTRAACCSTTASPPAASTTTSSAPAWAISSRSTSSPGVNWCTCRAWRAA